MAAAVAAQESWSGTDVRIAEVDRRLRELRALVGEAHHSTLTSVMNLVGWAPDERVAAEVEAVMDGLTDHHPSRAVIVMPGDGGEGVDARVEVMAQDARATGRVLQVEQVVLTLRGAVVAHAGSAVIPLLRSDLPTFLWWPGAPDPALPQFAELSRIADRIVTETGRALRGREALERLSEAMAASPAPITDLAWAVITPWRQLLASALRGEQLLRLRVTDAFAQITCRPGEVALEAWLLAGWLADVLGEHLEVWFAEAEGSEDIVGVEIATSAGSVAALSRDGESTVSLACSTCASRSLPLRRPDRRQLLAGELELRGRDRPFERALARAAALA